MEKNMLGKRKEEMKMEIAFKEIKVGGKYGGFPELRPGEFCTTLMYTNSGKKGGKKELTIIANINHRREGILSQNVRDAINNDFLSIDPELEDAYNSLRPSSKQKFRRGRLRLYVKYTFIHRKNSIASMCAFVRYYNGKYKMILIDPSAMSTSCEYFPVYHVSYISPITSLQGHPITDVCSKPNDVLVFNCEHAKILALFPYGYGR